MTKLLETAVLRLRELSEAEDEIAQRILADLEDEERWEEKFSRSQDILSRLATKARADIQAGKIRFIGMGTLPPDSGLAPIQSLSTPYATVATFFFLHTRR